MVIDENGIKISTWNEVLERRINELKEIYGDDIDLSQNTPDGQRVAIEARMEYDLQQFGVYIYNEMDPDLASMNGLRRLGKLNGIIARSETHSKWDINIKTDRNITIRDGFAIRDDLNQKWIAKEQKLTAGDNIITFTSDLGGSVAGGRNVRLETVINGILSAEPAGDVIVGRDGETPEEFRNRRRDTIAIAAQSIIGGLLSGLYSIEGVTDAKVYENDTAEEDPLTRLPAHSFYCVVEGGDNSEIAKVIAIHKTGGVRTVGDIEGIYTEEFEDGFSFEHKMRFDRPTYVDIHVRLKATRQEADEPIGYERIQMQIGSVKKKIGEDLQASELYEYAFTDVSRYIVTDLEISRDGSSYTDTFLQPAMNEKFILKPENVDVEVI